LICQNRMVDSAQVGLAVNFQEVVHSAPAVNADVAKLQ
jgi:hypothetical protein